MKPRGENVDYDKLTERYHDCVVQLRAAKAELDALKRTREQEADYANTCYENEQLRAELLHAHEMLTDQGHEELGECDCRTAKLLRRLTAEARSSTNRYQVGGPHDTAVAHTITAETPYDSRGVIREDAPLDATGSPLETSGVKP